MALDTRGIADGFIRGFEATDGYYNRQKEMGLREEDARMRKESHQVGLKSVDQQMRLRESQEQRAQDQYEHNLKAYENQQKIIAQQEKREQEAHSAKMGLTDANTRLYNHRLKLEQRAAFRAEKGPLIDHQWEQLALGDSDDYSIFDAPEIQGSKDDPRAYFDPKIQNARAVIEDRMQNTSGVDGFFSDPKAIEAVGVFYEPNVKAVIGQKSADGRVVKNAKLGGVHLAQDISPDIPGDQSGIVISIDVDYGDGKWVRKPVTENRSSDQNDFVKIIPLEHAMQDLMGQMKRAKMATLTSAYQKRLGSKQMEADLRKLLADIDNAEAKAIANGEISPEMRDQFNDLRTQATQRYNPNGKVAKENNNTSDTSNKPAYIEWALSDERKRAFIQDIIDDGIDLSSVPPEVLENAFNEAKKAKEIEERNKKIIDRAKAEYLANPEKVISESPTPYQPNPVTRQSVRTGKYYHQN